MMAQQPFRMLRGRAACGVQQSHGRGACVAAVDSSWHGSTARVLKFVVSVLFLGGLAGSRRCPQRHGATAQCCIFGGILVATSNRGRSSVTACAATRASTILQADPRTVEPWPCDSDFATGKIAQALGRGGVPLPPAGERLQLSLWILPPWICRRKSPSSSIGLRHAFLLEACWLIGPPCGLGESVGVSS